MDDYTVSCVYCENEGVNCCCECTDFICEVHSHKVGEDIFCPECIEDHENGPEEL